MFNTKNTKNTKFTKIVTHGENPFVFFVPSASFVLKISLSDGGGAVATSDGGGAVATFFRVRA